MGIPKARHVWLEFVIWLSFGSSKYFITKNKQNKINTCIKLIDHTLRAFKLQYFANVYFT